MRSTMRARAMSSRDCFDYAISCRWGNTRPLGSDPALRIDGCRIANLKFD